MIKVVFFLAVISTTFSLSEVCMLVTVRVPVMKLKETRMYFFVYLFIYLFI